MTFNINKLKSLFKKENKYIVKFPNFIEINYLNLNIIITKLATVLILNYNMFNPISNFYLFLFNLKYFSNLK
jgi:hypothetical protein